MLRSTPSDAANYGKEPPNHDPPLNPSADQHQTRNIVPSATYGDKRREAGMDPFGFTQLAAWQVHRVLLPPGPLFCVIDGQTRGRRWAATAARGELRDLAAAAGVRRRFAPHQLRHAHAVELAREGVAVHIIQRQLGHTDLGTTSTYLQGIDPIEIIDTVHSRRPPTIPMTAGLNL